MYWVACCYRRLFTRKLNCLNADKRRATLQDLLGSSVDFRGVLRNLCCSSQEPNFETLAEVNMELSGQLADGRDHAVEGCSSGHSFLIQNQPAFESSNMEQQADMLNRELSDVFGAQHFHVPSQAGADTMNFAYYANLHHPSLPRKTEQYLNTENSNTLQATTANGYSSSRASTVSEAHLTHVDEAGKASMVDVSQKKGSVRSATASARVLLGPVVYKLVAENKLTKGDVLTVAKLAGVMGAKHTSSIIPLCHNILLTKVHVELKLVPCVHAVDIMAEAKTVGPTGVEMEALTAASVSALTVYDMVKAASKAVTITDIKLVNKSGGKSGDYTSNT